MTYLCNRPNYTILTVLLDGYQIIFPVKCYQIGPSSLGEEIHEEVPIKFSVNM